MHLREEIKHVRVEGLDGWKGTKSGHLQLMEWTGEVNVKVLNTGSVACTRNLSHLDNCTDHRHHLNEGIHGAMAGVGTDTSIIMGYGQASEYIQEQERKCSTL